MLIECVPNISEGRNAAVIAACAAAIAPLPLLDTHTDPDHNRTVFTFAGAPADVTAAAFRLIREAARHIDLTQHTGQHPRIGAADVVPLVPLRGLSLAECGALARDLGQRVGEDLGLPVYLYEAAHPTGRTLPQIRRGGLEALRTDISTTRRPDYGPARLGAAGAVVIGARPLLIAFNVALTTSDVTIAKRIARTIRESSGGLPAVRALGMLVGGRAQVSMNLIDYTITSPSEVVAAVRAEAAKHNTEIHHSELVGLIPRGATHRHESWQLRPPLTPGRVLEEALARKL